MQESDVKVQKTPGKGLRIALAVSVALNLAVAGMAAGAFFHGGGPGGHGGDVRELGFGPFTDALSRADRDSLRASFLAKMPDIRAARQAMRTDQQNLLAALRAEPFDQTQLESALAAQSARTAAQLAMGQGLMKDLLIGMTSAQRRDFAARLEERLSRGHGGAEP